MPETPVETPVESCETRKPTMTEPLDGRGLVNPGRNGGWLRRGGLNPKRNGGRPPSKIRERCRGSFDKRIKVLEQIADDTNASNSDRLRALELMARYGLGTTITETDTEGRDAPGRLTPDERRARLLRELSPS